VEEEGTKTPRLANQAAVGEEAEVVRGVSNAMDYLHNLHLDFNYKELSFEISVDDIKEYFRRIITKDLGLYKFF